MAEPDGSEDGKFLKSKRNQGVQRTGRALLLGDPRFQDLSPSTRRAVIDLVGRGQGFGPSSFDLLMKPMGLPEISEHNFREHWSSLRLVEMKTTKKPIRNAALNRLFFGVTQNEIRLAEALGDRLLFAFVVLNEDNDFGRPFARLLTLNELRERTKPWRTQYQVNFRSDLPNDGLVVDQNMILVLDNLPPMEA